VTLPESPIVKRRGRSVLSPWVTLIDVVVGKHDGDDEVFHGMAVADYVIVCARTPSGLFPLVRQFRPIPGAQTLEFPGGLVDPGESPANTAAREFREETGLVATRLVPLGSYWTDTGRLTNRTHGFFAETTEPTSNNIGPLPELELAFFTRSELDAAIEDGQFAHGLHVGLYAIAKMRGVL
jgi:ADP-ribose pyrophosphatase